MAWTLAALLVLATVALIFAPWQQSVPGTGRVSALTPPERQQPIDAPVEGRIVRWHVVEGTRVRKGDRVIDIADNDPTLPMRLRAEPDAALDRIRAVSEREVQFEARVLEMAQSLQNQLVTADFRIQQSSDRIRGAEQALEAAEARELVTRQNLEQHRALFPN
jgi:multidrug efflux pump subunit AcrA (membrane-fusion protein)